MVSSETALHHDRYTRYTNILINLPDVLVVLQSISASLRTAGGVARTTVPKIVVKEKPNWAGVVNIVVGRSFSVHMKHARRIVDWIADKKPLRSVNY